MQKLGELAEIFRSKNAGPFLITIDIMFSNDGVYKKVKSSAVLNRELVASRYAVDPGQVEIFYLDRVRAIKVTLKRWGVSSGAPGDRDVYGAQQHGPLLDLEIPDSNNTTD